MVRRRRNPFPGVSTGPDRHGKLRHRLKRTVNGQKIDCYLPGPYGSTEFRRAYEEACEGVRLAGRRAPPGTVGYLIEAYLGSKGYLRLADSTRRDVRGRLDWIRDAIGGAKYAKIEPRTVRRSWRKRAARAPQIACGRISGSSTASPASGLAIGGRTGRACRFAQDEEGRLSDVDGR